MKRWVVAPLLLVSMLGLSTAWAQSASPITDPVARAHFEQGAELYAAGSYAEAEQELEAAYAIKRSPALLYALAQVSRLRGDCRKAVLLYREFLRTSPPAAEAQDARENLERCGEEDDPASAPASPPPPASQAPAPSPVAPTTPPVVLPPASAAPVRDQGRGPLPLDPLGATLLALSGATGSAGAVLLVTSGARHRTAGTATSHDDFERATTQAARQRGAALGALTVSGALLAVVTLRYLSARRHLSSPTTLAVSPAPDGVGVSLRGTF